MVRGGSCRRQSVSGRGDFRGSQVIIRKCRLSTTLVARRLTQRPQDHRVGHLTRPGGEFMLAPSRSASSQRERRRRRVRQKIYATTWQNTLVPPSSTRWHFSRTRASGAWLPARRSFRHHRRSTRQPTVSGSLRPGIHVRLSDVRRRAGRPQVRRATPQMMFSHAFERIPSVESVFFSSNPFRSTFAQHAASLRPTSLTRTPAISCPLPDRRFNQGRLRQEVILQRRRRPLRRCHPSRGQDFHHGARWVRVQPPDLKPHREWSLH